MGYCDCDTGKQHAWKDCEVVLKKKKQKKWAWYELLFLITFLVMAFCCVMLMISYWQQTDMAEREFAKLSEVMHPVGTQESESRPAEESNNVDVLGEYNSDCIGWIQIDGSGVDYPVMHTPYQPEYYLRRDFRKAYSIAGTPFLDAQCNTADSANLIVHGHNMKDGSMFASLEQYQDKQYGLEHQRITLYLEDEIRYYYLIAVLHFEVTQENVGEYYRIPQSAEDFDSYIKMLEEKSLYCGGYSAEWGEQLLILSTCDNKTRNGRIIVVAKQIEE